METGEVKPNLVDNNNQQNPILPLIAISSDSSSSSCSSVSSSDIDNSFFDNVVCSEAQSGIKRKLSDCDGGPSTKRATIEDSGAVSHQGLLARVPPEHGGLLLPDAGASTAIVAMPLSARYPVAVNENCEGTQVRRRCKQFWKAGDYEGSTANDCSSCTVGMDHVRVHPKFLHSNATSHKWALGAFAELLDNALDEVCSGATYVHIDVKTNKKDHGKMLVIEDNGGGMTPDKMRQCMSLGYSAKSKIVNTIGQYGNGFKTSTMRLGADVIVFSQSLGDDGKSLTRSIGMLSYSFLTGTGKEDIIVPMVDYQKRGQSWDRMFRSSVDDWNRNLDTIVQWSPYNNGKDLLQQFYFAKDHGTRIIIYNLWEDAEGNLELDFDTDEHDIQIREVNGDKKKLEMVKKYPFCKHFLTYSHSLRSYASMLYLRIPPNFRMILRGKDVEHHSIVNDMMLSQKITYRPQSVAERAPYDSAMVADVTIGFVKDAVYHIDIQGFNVYHKNRLIKPFWRVWNAAGSNGRGVIGVLEANFIEPAHDKQGFERTTMLARLESRLIAIQKDYWSKNCQKVGYVGSARHHGQTTILKDSDDIPSVKKTPVSRPTQNVHGSTLGNHKTKHGLKDKSPCSNQNASSPNNVNSQRNSQEKISSHAIQSVHVFVSGDSNFDKKVESSTSKVASFDKDGQVLSDLYIIKLKEENDDLTERLNKMSSELHYERDRCKALELQLKEAQAKREELEKEQIATIELLQEERNRRDAEEDTLRKRIADGSATINKLLERVKQLESTSVPKC